MNKKGQIFSVIDVGNTQIKMYDFVLDEIVSSEVISIEEEVAIKTALAKRKNNVSIFSSVRNEEENKTFINALNPTVVLTNKTPIPISIDDYGTPETLGVDRIANAVAAHHYSETENSLAIDFGSCITFDLVLNGRYQGGSISPGYGMRFKAMNHFTGNLPLLEIEDFDTIIGKSTKESMLSGVMNGVQAEIDGFIEHYTQEYSPLTFFLTGGDHKRFDFTLKNSIFADNNFTIKGLYLILKHNV